MTARNLIDLNDTVNQKPQNAIKGQTMRNKVTDLKHILQNSNLLPTFEIGSNQIKSAANHVGQKFGHSGPRGPQ